MEQYVTISRNDDGTFSLKLGPWVSALFVALFMFLLAQSIIALRWGAVLDSRVNVIETLMGEMRGTHRAEDVVSRNLDIRLVRLEERLQTIYDLLRRNATGAPTPPAPPKDF